MTGPRSIVILVITGVLVAPISALAQVPQAGAAGAGPAAINGIPPGPASVGGQNNSVYDPSGIGNATKTPPSAPGSTGAYTSIPASSAVVSPRRVAYPPRRGYERRATTRLSKREQQIRVKENDRLLNGKLTSICRGC